jgi:hypothetical protein
LRKSDDNLLANFPSFPTDIGNPLRRLIVQWFCQGVANIYRKFAFRQSQTEQYPSGTGKNCSKFSKVTEN